MLTNFTALPQRCLSDSRFRLRHFRVLGAVCRAVDKDSHCSLISQERVAVVAGMARRKVREALNELAGFGYLRKAKRRRTAAGRLATTVYEILYDEAEAENSAMAPRECQGPGHRESAKGNGTKRVPVPESNFPNISFSSREEGAAAAAEPLGGKDRGSVNTDPSGLARKEFEAKTTPLGGKDRGSVNTDPKAKPRDKRQRELQVMRPVGGLEVEAQRAAKVERERRGIAENAWLTRLFAEQNFEAVFAKLDGKTTARATDAELRRAGAGLEVALSEVDKARARA